MSVPRGNRDPANAWLELAACKGAPADLFYVERGETHDGGVRLCEACPVVRECRADVFAYESGGGVSQRHRFGLWAFTTPADRSLLAQGRPLDFGSRSCGTSRGWRLHRAALQEPCGPCVEAWERAKRRADAERRARAGVLRAGAHRRAS